MNPPIRYEVPGSPKNPSGRRGAACRFRHSIPPLHETSPPGTRSGSCHCSAFSSAWMLAAAKVLQPREISPAAAEAARPALGGGIRRLRVPPASPDRWGCRSDWAARCPGKPDRGAGNRRAEGVAAPQRRCEFASLGGGFCLDDADAVGLEVRHLVGQKDHTERIGTVLGNRHHLVTTGKLDRNGTVRITKRFGGAVVTELGPELRTRDEDDRENFPRILAAEKGVRKPLKLPRFQQYLTACRAPDPFSTAARRGRARRGSRL